MILVDFIIPTYNRVAPLKSMLASLEAQVSDDWVASVIVDNPEYSVANFIAEEYGSGKAKPINLEKTYNDWGHTPREIGKQKSEAEYVIMTGDDNYYMPTFVAELGKIVRKENHPGMIYWDMVHSHYDYGYFKCSPGFNQIDMGAFATRADLAKQIKLGTGYAADGTFVEDFKKKFPTEKIVKINKVLFVHN